MANISECETPANARSSLEILSEPVCKPVDELDGREKAESEAKPHETSDLRYVVDHRHPGLPASGYFISLHIAFKFKRVRYFPRILEYSVRLKVKRHHSNVPLVSVILFARVVRGRKDGGVNLKYI